MAGGKAMKESLKNLLAKIITGSATTQDFYQYSTNIMDIWHLFNTPDTFNVISKFDVEYAFEFKGSKDISVVKIKSNGMFITLKAIPIKKYSVKIEPAGDKQI
jgi:hypothetical protein